MDKTILLVDDSENDILLMRVALEKAEFNKRVEIARDGEEAIAYLEGRPPFSDREKYPLPSLVLLDLNMPKKNGFDVLSWAHTQPSLKSIPFVVLTASMRPTDIEQAYRLGANSYLLKPGRIEDLAAMLRCLSCWLEYNYFPPMNDLVRR